MADIPTTSCGVTAGAGPGSTRTIRKRQPRKVTERIVWDAMSRRDLPIGSMSTGTRRSSDRTHNRTQRRRNENAERDGNVERPEHGRRDAHVRWTRGTSLHTDE